jgi:hypothetical protein
MAKGDKNGRRVNKSAAVREALAKNPKAKSQEIVALLAEQGLKVAPTLVYYIKSKASQAARLEKRRSAAENPWNGAGDVVKLILRVKELAAEAGGIRNLKRLVDVLAE